MQGVRVPGSASWKNHKPMPTSPPLPGIVPSVRPCRALSCCDNQSSEVEQSQLQPRAQWVMLCLQSTLYTHIYWPKLALLVNSSSISHCMSLFLNAHMQSLFSFFFYSYASQKKSVPWHNENNVNCTNEVLPLSCPVYSMRTSGSSTGQLLTTQQISALWADPSLHSRCLMSDSLNSWNECVFMTLTSEIL